MSTFLCARHCTFVVLCIHDSMGIQGIQRHAVDVPGASDPPKTRFRIFRFPNAGSFASGYQALVRSNSFDSGFRRLPQAKPARFAAFRPNPAAFGSAAGRLSAGRSPTPAFSCTDRPFMVGAVPFPLKTSGKSHDAYAKNVFVFSKICIVPCSILQNEGSRPSNPFPAEEAAGARLISESPPVRSSRIAFKPSGSAVSFVAFADATGDRALHPSGLIPEAPTSLPVLPRARRGRSRLRGQAVDRYPPCQRSPGSRPSPRSR